MICYCFIIVIIIQNIIMTILQAKILNKTDEVLRYECEVITPQYQNVILNLNTITKQMSKSKNPILWDTTFKAYMDYRKITDVTSTQWGLQQKAYTDNNGLRKIDDYYCIALGTYYTKECGEKFKISLDSGITFNAIVADIKHPDDTDELNRFTPLIDKNNNPICNGNGIPMVNVVEFVVDENILSNYVRYTKGCVSSVGFHGNVIAIEKIGE